MEYIRTDYAIYARIDPGDEIISCILDICNKENVLFATYYGIGGCSMAEIQTLNPETNIFETRKIEGLLELASLTGSVTMDDGGVRYHHTHAVFAYKEDGKHFTAAGHMKSIVVSYTAEIEIRPVRENIIKRKYHAETGTGLWDFRK